MLRKAEQLYLDRLFKPIGKFFKPGMQVLDAGCGIGKDAEYLNRLGCRVTAIDLVCQPAHWPALSGLGIAMQEASAEALPFADATFDAVWAKDALHHMQNPLQALREFMRVVKPGCPVFLIEANRYNPLFYLHLTLLGNHQHFSRRRLRAMLDQIDPQHTLFLAESRCLP
jgi:ubiquinone/menaquinone biosynthesis C-methylase UbiE